MSRSPRLDLPLLMAQQAQKHLTINDSLRRLDVLVQTAVRSADRSDEPNSAEEGDLFILPEGRTGASWSAMAAHAIALFENGGFVEIAPVAGQLAYVLDRGAFVLFDGQAWRPAPFAENSPSTFAVNADPSTTNRLTVAADAELLTHDARTPGSGDARKVINKADANRTAAVLFQTAYAGRAEIGLVGNDDLSFRVSADGVAFRDALRIDAASAHVAVGKASPAVCALDVAGPVRVATYAKADLPAAGAGAGQIVYVSDESGGPVLAFSDGTEWRRVTDRALVA